MVIISLTKNVLVSYYFCCMLVIPMSSMNISWKLVDMVSRMAIVSRFLPQKLFLPLPKLIKIETETKEDDTRRYSERISYTVYVKLLDFRN